MVPTLKLASGYEMPIVGFGLWKVGAETCADTVYNAIKAGYRLFDGAYDYANEKEAGEGIRRAIDEGLVKREDLFVTSKIWNNYHAAEHAEKMAKSQLETWNIGYLDLFLIHFPVSLEFVDPKDSKFPGWWLPDGSLAATAKVPISETWKVLESLVDAKLVRSIGVSNFQSQLLFNTINEARHPVSVLQIEHHPYLTQPGLVLGAQENGVQVTAYSSFGAQSFLELPEAFRGRAKGLQMLLEHETTKGIAGKLGKTPAQVLLRWSTQRGIAVIPKSNNPERLAQNLAVTDFDLAEDDIKALSSLDKGLRFNDPGYYLDKPLRIFG
ncbi:Aldo/keto reductase [Patellaria atrata CBS 101060]|uniref:Aldo/keto reductase n=1 Tax=Patellaria atrata CBS 101060 TaxID=1346257 RepID=A0A9P4SF67_9PEZI|nr:Aldo/keto reductase [Patellaria atrata CBS 101060]